MKKTILATALFATLFCSSCLGPDPAYNSLKNWNAKVTDQDWLNELIFLGMHVIPVYGVAMFGDLVVFNVSGYWTGDYILDVPGPFPGFTRED